MSLWGHYLHPRQVVAVRGNHWKRTTSQPCSKRGGRRSQGTIIWSVPGQITEQSHLEVVSSRDKVAGNSPRGFAKNQCCLSNFIAFYDEVAVSVDEWGAVGMPSLSVTCSMVSCSIFLVRLETYRLDGWTTRWVSNRLDCWASKVWLAVKSQLMSRYEWYSLGFNRGGSNV